MIKIELTKEKTRSRIIIGALGVGLGFTGLLLIKPEMQKTVRQSVKAALKDLLLSKPALVTKVALTEALDITLQTVVSMSTAAATTALAANDIFSDALKRVF